MSSPSDDSLSPSSSGSEHSVSLSFSSPKPSESVSFSFSVPNPEDDYESGSGRASVSELEKISSSVSLHEVKLILAGIPTIGTDFASGTSSTILIIVIKLKDTFLGNGGYRCLIFVHL